ncbi:MAG: methyltransferase, TIGR04325 family, partial [Myxococcota bacterium]
MLRRTVRRVARHPAVRWLRAKEYERHYRTGRGGRFFGAFASLSEAQSWDPSASNSSYDDPELVGLNLDGFLEVQLFDWPVIHALNRFAPTSLTDLGGHIGVKYYAFREHLELGDDFQWHVVELPAMVQAGERERGARGGSHLRFHTKQANALSPCLLCSGSLQYVDRTLEETLDTAGDPELLVLNKLPLTEGTGFWTLENFKGARVPYRVFSESSVRQI